MSNRYEVYNIHTLETVMYTDNRDDAIKASTPSYLEYIEPGLHTDDSDEAVKPRLYVVMGLSGAGKDTVATYLEAINVKWSAYAKRFYEQCYNLPEGFLDDREKRLQVVPGENFTYLDVLKRGYEAWDIIDTKLTVRPTTKQILILLEDGHNVVLTDTRKYSEVEAIAHIGLSGYKVILIHVFGRSTEQMLESDRLLPSLLLRLHRFASSVHEICNTGSAKQLQDKVSGIDWRANY